MFMTVLMSTSRSALMALIVVAFILIFNGIKHKEERKKVSKIATFAIGAIIVGILLFTTVGMYLKLDSKFVDEVVFRLTDEPIAIIQKALGQNYNVQNLGSMDWREEASADAYAAYMHLPFNEQLTGIGQGGFLDRNLGHGLNPHNGILLILIETGIIGLLLYIIMVGGVIGEAIKLKHISPSFAVLVFTLIYGIGQNGEMTSTTTFLFVATMIAEQKFIKMTRNDPDFSLEAIHA
jgi:O-antigen ligase